MGNSQSNSINGEINKILQEAPDASSAKNDTPLDLKFNDDVKKPSKYVSAETDDKRSVVQLTPSKKVLRKNKSVRRMSPTSSAHMDLGELNVKCTYSVTSVDSHVPLNLSNMQKRSMSPTSSEAVPRVKVVDSATSRVTTSPTSSESVPAGMISSSATSTDASVKKSPKVYSRNSATSSEAVPKEMIERSASSNNSRTSSEAVPTGTISNSSTSSDVPKPERKKSSWNLFSKPEPKPEQKIIKLNANIMESSDNEPSISGGYTYAAEASEIDHSERATHSNYSGGNTNNLNSVNNIITLDSNLFETSENNYEPSNSNIEKKNDFDPEKFFKEMQTGGIYEPRNKEHKKGKIERYLSSNNGDEDEEGFDFAESTEGLDVNSNEDTEDLKAKVKHLRMMVARSKGKKSSKSSKKSQRKAKRMTESSGGASESISNESESYESRSNESGSYESGSNESGTNESATQNSVSEYLDTTSSISTSDVRLISMNKMRK